MAEHIGQWRELLHDWMDEFRDLNSVGQSR
jgi:hypothetical protein